MFIKQLSVFIENKKGRMLEVAKLMGNHKIDIRALSVADTSDFGILRIIVNNPERAVEVFKESGYAVSLNDVIAISVEDKPGGLADAMQALYDNGIEVDYMYAFNARKAERGFVVMRTNNLERSIEALKSRGIDTLSEKKVYDLLV